MSEMTMDQKFVAYEYETKNIKRDNEPLYRDCYKSFGWEVSTGSAESMLADLNEVTLSMKRDRRIPNRSEVNALQRKCEGALSAIESLEGQKTSRPTIAALIVGLVGTVFMTLAVFSMLWSNIPLVVVFGAIGLIGWGAAFLTYLNVKKKKAVEIAPMIDAQFDLIYNACEQASMLLH